MTVGSYAAITVSRVNAGSVDIMAVFNNNGTTDVRTKRDSYTDRVADQGLVLMTLSLIGAGCDDIGKYRCSHDNGQMSEGEAEIISKFIYLDKLIIKK